MNWFKRIFHYIWVNAWYVSAGIVVLIAALFTVLRLLLPFADQYNAELSQKFSEALNQPVVVNSLNAEWHGLGPSLILENVNLLDAKAERYVLQLEKVRIGFNLFHSLMEWRPIFSDVTLVGVNLAIKRTKEGSITVEGITDKESKSKKEEMAPFLGWVFSQN